MSDVCYVYVIGIPEMDLSKIGISRNPSTRLSQLRTGSPFTMELRMCLRTPSDSTARSLESAFHKVMESKRRSGEWFHLSLDEACRILAINLLAHLRFAVGFEAEEAISLLSECGVPAKIIDCLDFDSGDGRSQ